MKNFRLVVIAASLVLAVIITARIGWAQETMPDDSTDLNDLDQRLKILERRWELFQEETTKKDEGAPVVIAGKEGFGLKSPDGSFQLKLRGIVQADFRSFQGDSSLRYVDGFQIRRARPIIEGTLFKYYGFRITPDFGLGKVVLYDAYLDIAYWPTAKFRIGKFKPPVGLERLQSASDILFYERAFPTLLVPNRDIGIQLSGDIFGGRIFYAVGVFNGIPDGANSDAETNDSKDAAARLFFQPFKGGFAPLEGLGFGVSGSFGEEEGSAALPSYKTTGGYTFFKYSSAVIADGEQSRFSPHLYYYYGPLGLFGEYVQSSLEVKKGTTTTRVDNSAWQVAVSYVVTGGKTSYKGVAPKKPLDPLKGGGWGELQIAARYSVIELDHDAFDDKVVDSKKYSESAAAWAVGLNWYLNSAVRVIVNYEQTDFDAVSPAEDPDPEQAVLGRFQINF